MWPRINAWVMAPGSASRVDDRDGWVFFTADANEKSFSWKGIAYTSGITAGAAGHHNYELPPGTYIVWAERTDDRRTMRTHKAVVAVHDEPIVTVRLLPDVKPEGPVEPPEPHECRITVDAVQGLTPGGYPDGVKAMGTAEGCQEVHVTVRTPSGGKNTGVVTVEFDGSWTFAFDNAFDDGTLLICSEPAFVDVRCMADPNCRKQEELTVRCPRA
ncbi:hypothetical protein [Streptomyces albireticuli]|uniref:hypothetical protein n=1 Tax=Streptomyces albireticuli TaxID=1940 RepID=UPI00118030C8|nr:hypothetical protein [Streptomyces albireticuli]MCD9146017.1 hypothetical protein [Streptomyces albireticuli]MCD9166247.1 hypothetical protein [Streptomyces albireticuli]MCD9196564.1 hypothetical protein [Streptomyces albireticuli]